MQPAFVIVLNEVGQEACCGACTRRVCRARGVIQFGKIRRQLAAVEIRQRQTPERFVFCRGACQQAGRQLVIKAEQRMVVVTQRRFAAPVRVAISIINSGFWAEASIRPSASTRRPSASVFITSTFCRCGSE